MESSAQNECQDIDRPEKIVLNETEWKERLDEFQFQVMRAQGTERAFSGKYWDNKADGTYNCSACGLPLFSSEAKYRSGTGWPSFYAPIDPCNVILRSDGTHGMVRTEVVCARCDGHLGHLFDDGPEPTGLRYCMNSISLKFDPE